VTGKALETIFFERDTKGRSVFNFAKRAGTPVTFAFELKSFEEVIVPEHLFDGDALLEIFEGKNMIFQHG
jgi:hypothetical protein